MCRVVINTECISAGVLCNCVGTWWDI